MPTGALETLGDPLLDPILGLLQDAVNADLAPLAQALGGDGAPFIKTVAPRPFDLSEIGDDALPALYAYRVRSRTRQGTFVHRDHLATLQFHYITPAVAQELIDNRWPVLDRVWRVALRALDRGHHSAHQNDAPVLEDVEVIKIDLTTAQKREAFTPGGNNTYPSFLAEIDVTWRDGAESDLGALHPALSFDAQIFVDTEGDVSGTADVIGRALTPAGAEDPEGREFERPADWSL
jgi:hypothetical protein